MKRKILFFLPDLSGGGAERVTLNIINNLPKEQFETTLVLVRNIINYQVPNHIKIVCFNKQKIILSILVLRKFLKENEFDVVYSTLLDTHIALYMSLLNFKNKPKLILRQPNSPLLLKKNNQIGFLKTEIIKYIYKECDSIIAQTSDMKDEIISFYKIDSSKISVMINPLDEEYILSRINNQQSPFDLSKVNVVAAGRLSRQKGYDSLIKAFELVVGNNNNFILHIIGEDKGELISLKELVVNLNLENNVNFWGFQENPYRFFYYADLYVLSSRWEGLPNTILENMFLGKRIVSTRCIEFLETIIKDGDNGYLVKVDDIEALSTSILSFNNLNEKQQIISSNNLLDIFLN